MRVAIEETELQLLSAPKECKRLWLESNPGSESIVTRYVTGAMDYIDTMAPAMVFAVGSMYLAGAIYAHMKLEAEVYREEGVEV